jgi:hypothetical protein
MVLRDYNGEITQFPYLLPGEKQLNLITHDESTFYGNDQRRVQWMSSKETAKPIRKGEGKSIMVSDFCSPEFGWLKSEDGCDNQFLSHNLSLIHTTTLVYTQLEYCSRQVRIRRDILMLKTFRSRSIMQLTFMRNDFQISKHCLHLIMPHLIKLGLLMH